MIFQSALLVGLAMWYNSFFCNLIWRLGGVVMDEQMAAGSFPTSQDLATILRVWYVDRV
jgi:hypothetical protein